MDKETLLISEENIKGIFENKYQLAVDIVKNAFVKFINGDVKLPDKISQIFNEKLQNRINCMPATLVSDKLCGVKWVSVFPNNPSKGLRNVEGTIILSELENGHNVSIMDGTYITSIRTAAVGALAASYLSKVDSEVIGFIGAGSEAKKHFEMIKTIRPTIKKCYVSSRRDSSTQRFVDELSPKYGDVEFVNCEDDYKMAVSEADIIVTATSTQQDLLKASWVKKGSLYIHVGGWEDEYAVANKADKIVCDNWESVKHRSQTISRMYLAGLLTDEDIYSDLGDIISGEKAGRENDNEFIYFNSVGLAFIDVEFARYVYEYCFKNGIGTMF